MKKNYVKPSVEVIKVNAVNNMLATSLPINGTQSVDTTVEGEQLGRKNNSSFGNIWDSQW